MITEKRFSLSHAAFWEQLIPMAEHYIRRRNLSLNRYLSPLKSSIDPFLRGLVNEIGFRLFAESIEYSQPSNQLPEEVVGKCITKATYHISHMRQYARQPVPVPGEQEVREAHILAERLAIFFEKAQLRHIQPFPIFPGCGWLDECQGDLLAADIIFEVKAGRRRFRSADVRQLLCYCALGFASKRYQINAVCLVNPRMGTFLQDSLENMCRQLAGQSAVDVLAEVADYVSEPNGRYWTG